MGDLKVVMRRLDESQRPAIERVLKELLESLDYSYSEKSHPDGTITTVQVFSTKAGPRRLMSAYKDGCLLRWIVDDPTVCGVSKAFLRSEGV